MKRSALLLTHLTVLPDLSPIMVDLSKRKHTGTINLTNPGVITHNEILEMYKELVDPDFKWKNFTIEEQNKILASGRSNNALDTSKLESLYPNVLSIKESVRKCLERMRGLWQKGYEPKNILITGGCGFHQDLNVMSYLANNYKKINFINLDKLDYCSSENSVEIDDRDSYTFYKGNNQ